MRTADDYVKMYADFRNDLNMTDSIKLLVETVRKEAIEECAEKAKSEWIRYGTNMGHSVDKQSILSLIKELK